MKLDLQLIRTLGLKEKTYKPDWDDTAIEFELTNGIALTGYSQINNESKEVNSLEGLDGWLYVIQFDELEKINKMDYMELIEYVKNNNPDFPIEVYKCHL